MSDVEPVRSREVRTRRNTGGFGALRGLLGEGAPLSASSIARLKAGWRAEYEALTTRSLADSQIVYLWVDGVYVKAGLEGEKAALLVAVGGVRDGSKLVVIYSSRTTRAGSVFRLSGWTLVSPIVIPEYV